ncbi:MAG TPA: hypothetical protein VFR97_13785 [Capillimicrobium sp.]|nr:hypothetical protein [Capillimicrobium sp.]
MLRILGRGATVLTCLVVVSAGAASEAAASRTLDTGYLDPSFMRPETDPAAWLARAAQSGADIVRIAPRWSALAPTQPADAADPSDPAYDFGLLDAAVRSAAANHLRVLLTVTGAPRWAEGGNRPAQAAPGSWRPDPVAFGELARALARRYSGEYPDPNAPGSALPGVHAYQGWNEPNLSLYLAPQWTRRHGRLEPASPSLYRELLNSFYRGIRSVTDDALVVAAGTAPYGDPAPGGDRMPPARFIRELLCFRNAQLDASRCAEPARLDVLDHHPYSVGKPTRAALNPDDVSIPDLAKLVRPLRRAERLGHVLPAGPKELWATEVSWDTDPPDPDGISLGRQARWLAETFRLLWRQGASTVMWFRVGDERPDPSYDTTYQSGTYFADGRAKPSARAFAFPFVAQQVGQRTRLWGVAPSAGRLVVELRRHGTWHGVASLRVRERQVFQVSTRRRDGPYRARVASYVSLPDTP